MRIDEQWLRDLMLRSANRMDFWENVLLATNVRTLAEIGVFKGAFASQMLEACPSIERYYMIDPWALLPDWNKPANFRGKDFEDIYQEAMDATAFAAEKRVVLRGTTKDMADEIPDASLDFAYVDGDHTLRGMTIDLIKVLPKMKPGGIIAGDDFTPNPWHHGEKFEPTMVCPFSVYFAEAHNLPIFALPFNQCLIHVQPARGFSFIDLAGKYGDLSLNKITYGEGLAKRRMRRAARRLAKAKG